MIGRSWGPIVHAKLDGPAWGVQKVVTSSGVARGFHTSYLPLGGLHCSDVCGSRARNQGASDRVQ